MGMFECQHCNEIFEDVEEWNYFATCPKCGNDEGTLELIIEE